MVYLLIALAALLLLHLVFQYLNLERYNEKQGQVFEISNRVDMDDEASLPTWFSQFLLLGIGVTALVTSRFETNHRLRRLWGFIGIVGILFSINEVAAIHEFILQSAHLLYYGEVAPTAVLNAWWLALPFIFIAAGFLLWWINRLFPRRTVILFFVAGIFYISGAAGLDLVSNDLNKSSFAYQGVATAIEEGFEMLGAITALYTVLAYLESQHSQKLAGLVKLLNPKT